MRIKSWGAALLGASLVALASLPAPAEAGGAAKSVGGCALLGKAKASKIFGAATVSHETNQRNPNEFVQLNRGCTYTGDFPPFGYNVWTFTSKSMAKKSLSEMATAAKQSERPGAFLMEYDKVTIHGFPGFAAAHRLIPDQGEPEPALDYIANVVVRKGSLLFMTSYASNTLTSYARDLRPAAKVIVARM